MSNSKIKMIHLNRQAINYLRQSTQKQVRLNQEPTKRQYALQQRAIELGWNRKAIEIIGDDLRQSGTSVLRRVGFRRLTEDVFSGRISAIFAIEVSL